MHSDTWKKAKDELVDASGEPLNSRTNPANRPARLFHFTDPDGVVGIFKGSCLRASLAPSLNDPSEVVYRNGRVERTLTTPNGTRTVRVPRGRIAGTDGATAEFHSQVLPRYARRTREIDEAILGCYLGGVNSRRIRTALKPLLGEQHLSKSAVSRIVGRLKALFATWQDRDLSTERYAVIFLDGFHLKVRLATRRSIATNLWWTDVWSLDEARKAVRQRRGEDKRAAYYKPSAFRAREAFVEELRTGGYAGLTERLRTNKLPLI